MIIKISNKDIHRHTYRRRKPEIKGRKMKVNKTSFGEIFSYIQSLKEQGVISLSSMNISVSKATKNSRLKNTGKI